jgi:protocatechuate 3,4-dioxygenase beta subunit
MSISDDQQEHRGRRGLRRRDAFAAAGSVGLGGLFTASRLGRFGAAADAEAASACVLTPEVTEGPYWVSNHLMRRDIRAGKPGLPLEVLFTVQNANTCKPISNANVEIWHCDAVGVYSGYENLSQGGPPRGGGGHATPTSNKRYLRGHQKSGANGKVSFLTIFPGWYRGRSPHIHLKVHIGGNVVHTGQVFFSQKIADAVYRHAPYKSHGEPDTTHAQDSIYAAAGGSKALLELTRRGNGNKGYRGTITLGVATA